MDIDELRDAQITLYQLDKADETYTFYHDETNNVGKLHVGAKRLNVPELKVFVLGGVVHEGEPHPIDVQALRTALNIHQRSAREIKLKHIAKGSFLELFQSAKLTTFLEWITDMGLMVHYHSFDPLYWSTADIVDSVLPNNANTLLHQHHALLKSDLVTVLRVDLAATTALFHRYGYPGLANAERKSFLNDLIQLLESNRAVLPEFNHFMLKGVLEAGRKLPRLVFIEGNPSDILVEHFGMSYSNRIVIFKHARHIFDAENSIRKRLEELSLSTGGDPISNYRFADSQNEPGIQLSDIVVGVLGKMHSYFTETPPEEVLSARASLSGRSLQNAELLRDLIATSEDTNIAFLHHVASLHDLQKLDMFLRFHDGAYVS